jgi:tRNA(Arg) A34 adenosine deaminase TadA
MPAPTANELSKLDHEKLMRRAIELSASAANKGNKPFAALLADLDGNIVLEAENTEFTDNDATRHSEVDLMSKASKTFSEEELGRLVMFVSAEPCGMCAGATVFTGVRAVVYGLSGEALAPMWVTDSNPNPALLAIACRTVFESCEAHPTTVIGPIMEEEAAQPHHGFWERWFRARAVLD